MPVRTSSGRMAMVDIPLDVVTKNLAVTLSSLQVSLGKDDKVKER
jgi:hypothetical protein